MKYIRDAVSGDMVPICIDCVCASCTQLCSECEGDTEDGCCVKYKCIREEGDDV